MKLWDGFSVFRTEKGKHRVRIGSRWTVDMKMSWSQMEKCSKIKKNNKKKWNNDDNNYFNYKEIMRWTSGFLEKRET